MEQSTEGRSDAADTGAVGTLVHHFGGTPRTVRTGGVRLLARGCLLVIRLLWWTPVVALIWNDTPYPLELVALAAPILAVATGLVSATLACARERRAAYEALVACAATLALCWIAGARASGTEAWSGAGERVRVVTYNAFGQHSVNDDAFFDWLRDQDADLVCMIDPPLGFIRARKWVEERYPNHLEPAPGLEWEIVLLSKKPFTITHITTPSERVVFSFPAHRSVRLTLDNGSTVLFTAMHPRSPRKADSVRHAIASVRLDGELIADWLRGHDDLAIVAGDFNSTPTGSAFRTFAEASGLHTWASILWRGTWPAWAPTWASFPIDRLWVSPRVRILSAEVGPRFASDHRPVVAELELPPPKASASPSAPAR